MLHENFDELLKPVFENIVSNIVLTIDRKKMVDDPGKAIVRSRKTCLQGRTGVGKGGHNAPDDE